MKMLTVKVLDGDADLILSALAYMAGTKARAGNLIDGNAAVSVYNRFSDAITPQGQTVRSLEYYSIGSRLNTPTVVYVQQYDIYYKLTTKQWAELVALAAQGKEYDLAQYRALKRQPAAVGGTGRSSYPKINGVAVYSPLDWTPVDWKIALDTVAAW